MLESHRHQIPKASIKIKRMYVFMEKKSLAIRMLNLAKEHGLVNPNCFEYEFNIAKLENGEIFCFSIEYWPNNRRFDELGKFIEPNVVMIPSNIQNKFNALATQIISES